MVSAYVVKLEDDPDLASINRVSGAPIGVSDLLTSNNGRVVLNGFGGREKVIYSSAVSGWV